MTLKKLTMKILKLPWYFLKGIIKIVIFSISIMFFVPFYCVGVLIAIGGNEDTYSLIMDKYYDFIDWVMKT